MSKITSAEYQAGYAAGFRDGKKEGLENTADLVEEARFLLARIDELDWSDRSLERFADEWNGHVEPPLYRLKSALSKATP